MHVHNTVVLYRSKHLRASKYMVILHRLFKVEPYPIPGSFLKLEYLKTELNVDKGTYAIV